MACQNSRNMSFRMRNPGPRRRPQRGLSLVELMVGIAIGLFIVAAASLVVSSQLNDNRRLLLELQLQQDLRATADIVTRELRRAGGSGIAERGVVNPALVGGETAVANAYLALRVNSVVGSVNSVEYKYKRSNDEEGPFGYRLDSDGVVRARLTSSSGWQDLSDINTLVVDTFAIIETDSAPVVLPCPKDCPVGTGDACWPTVTVREFNVTISGRAPSDAAIRRSVTTQVRLRNDQVKFLAGGAVSAACPT
jgi:prepilin-type N-terminal cleavage/methylation domain-containing protein